MAIAIDPETGHHTTTFTIEQRAIERARRAERDERDRQEIVKAVADSIDADKWRSLPEAVRKKYDPFG